MRFIGGFLWLGLVIGMTTLPNGSVTAQESSEGSGYSPASSGTRWLESASGLTIKMLVERSILGGSEVDLGEITFPVGAGTRNIRGHLHESVEIFYILSGRFEHVVNGVPHVLEPGMVGIVRPGDRVVHRVLSDVPVKALVIWAPGGEASRLARFFHERPVEDN